ncbi:MAG: RpoL/Rpb11 RNA polymerase subunit family protein [Candidatus Caldarchaeum sp.]
MVKLRVLEEDESFMLVEVVGEDQSLVGLLTETINEQNGVLYAGYRIEHPLTGIITMSVKVDPEKTTPREAIKKAFKELHELVDRLKQEV